MEPEGSAQTILKKDILRRQPSLTAKEQKFLTNLINEGNTSDILKANAVLNDNELFFLDECENGNETRTKLEISKGDTNSERDNLLKKIKLEKMSSTKRLSAVANRSNCTMQSNLWKAHEEGIKLGTNSRFKSLVSRQMARMKSNRNSKTQSKEIEGGKGTKSRIKFQKLVAMAVKQNKMSSTNEKMKVSKSLQRYPSISEQDSEQGSTSEESKKDISSIFVKESSKAHNGKEGSEASPGFPTVTRATPLRREESILGSESLGEELQLNRESRSPSSSKKNLQEESKNHQQLRDASSPIKDRPHLTRLNSKGSGFEIIFEQFPPMTGSKDRPTLTRAASRGVGFEAGFDLMAFNPKPAVIERRSSFDDLKISFLTETTKEQEEPQKYLLDDISCASWDGNGDDSSAHYDAWSVIDDDEANGYGGGGSLDFMILGTSATDEEAKPHVLSPPLMDSLSSFLPYSVAEQNYWLKFSLVRDGASLYSLLQHVRGSKHTILAIETVDGDVFGSFTSTTWKKNHGFYGNGEAFLWKMKQNRNTPCSSILDQAMLESELEVFPWTGSNYMVQFCTHERIGLGGGTEKNADEVGEFGLVIENDLLKGSTGLCSTFNNSRLGSSEDGVFEVANLEVWTMTPCIEEEEAEKLELSLLFVQSHLSQ